MKSLAAYINVLDAKPALPKGWLFLLLAALFLPHWIYSYHYIQSSIAPDLLLRTIGSRLQEAGKPIYQYKWQPGDPVIWLNPYSDTRVGLNGVVSTPFLLWLLQPLSKLNYCTVRNVWGVVQELLLFSTTWFCCITFSKRFNQFVFIIVAVVFFVYDRNWILNVYNGQMYILYAFVFSLTGYLCYRKNHGKAIVSLLIIASAVRPFFITAIVPLFKLKKSYLLALLVAAGVTLFMVAATTSIDEWKQYSSAMKMYAKEQTGHLLMDTVPSTLHKYADQCTINPEGTFTVFGGGCLYSLQHYLYLLGISINNVQIFQAILLCTLLLVWLAAYIKQWLISIEKQLLLAFMFYQLSELITPASRNPYNMIQWLPAVAWLIAWGNKTVLWLIVIGLCLNHDIPFRVKYEREIGEALLFIAAGWFLYSKRESISNP